MQYVSWKELRRVGGTAGVTTFLALMLSGCIFANNVSPVDLGVDEGDASLAFCRAGTVTSIRVIQRQPASDQWDTLWEGVGKFEVRQGEVLTLDDSVDGLDGGGEGVMNPTEGTKYALQITYSSRKSGGQDVAYEPAFNAPSGGLADGVWLNYQGGASTSPCSD